jgi:prepilin-type N-terminal cleavage/methylation domain-containing protein
MNHAKSFSRGITMIELLVVISIIGLLAAVLVPLIGPMFAKGKEADAREDMRRLGQAALAYKTDHEGHYPAAGGYIYEYRDSGSGEERYGRAVGWVNFGHKCDTYCVDGIDPSEYLGDGSHELGDGGNSMSDFTVNERGMCLCFKANQADGGINPRPAAWFDTNADTGLTEAQAAIRSGAIFELINRMDTYVNPNFAEVAVEKKLARSEKHVVRAYAMNVIMGTDEEIYSTNYYPYDAQGKGRGGYPTPIQWGAKELYARERGGSDGETARAEPNRTVLFVEMDLDDLSESDELKGDQVWDWDNGNESIGFNFDEGGQKFGFICFAGGHVERINDPSTDSESPDMNKRRKLSKWYGSGGVCADGEKLD